MLAESIVAKLSAAGSATAALIGDGSACRLYPGIAPVAAAAPYCVYTELPGAPDNTLGEASTSGRRPVQFSVVAATYLAARQAAAAIKADLDNATLAGGEQCLSCSDPYDGYSEATDQHLAHVDADFFAAPDA